MVYGNAKFFLSDTELWLCITQIDMLDVMNKDAVHVDGVDEKKVTRPMDT